MTNEELSLKTKKSLSAALKQALEKKPLSKVTVSELIAACNINRKTFYYHFQDIYDLMRWTLEEEAIAVVKNYDIMMNTDEVFHFIMDYVEQNRHIIHCAYDAMGYEGLRHFFQTDVYGVLYNVIGSCAENLSLAPDPSFQDFLANFYTEAAAGILIDWIKNRVTLDRELVLQDLMLIYRVSIPKILQAKAEQAAQQKGERDGRPV